MRLTSIVAALAGMTLLAPPMAHACDARGVACLPPVVVFPVFTPEGERIGVVDAGVRRPPSLEISRFTGQPLGVVYNNPRRIAGAVDPEFVLMTLPRVRHFGTRAVYPRGY